MRTVTALVAALLMMPSCGDDDTSNTTTDTTSGDATNPDSTSGLSCTITADLEIQNTPPKSFKALGSITCTGPATLEIEVCAQLGGVDAQCESSTSSGVTTMAQDVAIACIGTKTLRARVTGSVNGQATDEVLSDAAEIQCQ